MKGHGLLTRIISESKITAPDQILNLLAKKLHYDLDFENSKIEDGMDMGVCMINKKENTISFSGARHPLLIIDKGKHSVIKGDRKSIGGKINDLPFTCNKISISKTANYFMYSDGYIDQFGGKNDKKFKSVNFIKLLESSYGKGAQNHLENLEENFMNWRGQQNRKLSPQTDDVLVIGFSV